MATCPPVMDPVGTTLNVQVPNRGISRFTFDSLLWSASQQDVPVATQQDVYTETGVPVVEATFAGYNSCIFAYGQTGSGKTHTMMGGDGDTEKGLLPRVSEEVFQRAQTEYASKTCTFEVSFMEIYCEKVKDLLNSEQCSKDKYDSLKVRQHPVKGVFVDGVRKMSVSTWEDCRKLLQRGARQRVTASTSMNDKSSRSHAIFTLTLTVGETTRMSSSGRVASSQRTSCIHLVDLAGSERVSKTGATGHLLEEATQINLSLTVLRKVIDALVERSLGGSGKGSARLLPVRESMLTWILSDSLGGNSKTTMIATVSPSPDNIEETISTLRYAVKARSIVNMTKVNEDSHARIVRDLQTELQKLKSEQQDRTNDTYVLADQIKLNEEALAEVKRAALATANQHMKLLEEERTKRHNAEEEIKKLTQRLHNVQRALLIREAALKGVQDQESRCSLCSVM
eukprot:TRINITY_DN6168_c0_g1_i1.p1 TRINITY_DN6168_c0_g1~~TRINITY_DN6168_c0_g1_i1.p1  ORF type:complete len:455 (+),score=112.86 TRINITY_DN6168_c0_g1_i1:478-1842(+)